MTPYLPSGVYYNNSRTINPTKKALSWKLPVIIALWLAVAILFPGLRGVTPAGSANGLLDYSNLGKGISSYLVTTSGSKAPNIYAKSFVLLDSESSELIVSKDEALSLPVASTTKITTALTAFELYKPDEIITVPKKATLINGSKIGLRTGEKITATELLKGLLISSGNDAAYTLALALDQKQEDPAPFVSKMNEFLQAHHIRSSKFADPAGLDDEKGRSTSIDLAHISRILLGSGLLATIVSTANATISSQDGAITHQLKSSNRLLLNETSYYMPGVVGVKTGFTLDAGHCLVAAYQWHDRTLIGVILNTTESSIEASAKEMYKLFRWADANLSTQSY